MTVDEKLDLILLQMQEMKDDIRGTKDDIQSTKDDIQEIKGKVTSAENRLTSIELTLENVTNNNIKIIAEDHFDLSRKPDDALKIENQKEMMLLRVNIVENEIRIIKEKLSQIA